MLRAQNQYVTLKHQRLYEEGTELVMRLDLAIMSSSRSVELTSLHLLGLQGQYPPHTVDFDIELTFDWFLQKKLSAHL